MSKRFGRNQKRRLREEITRLRNLYLDRDTRLVETSQLLSEARATVQGMVETIEAISPHSIAVPVRHETGTDDQLGKDRPLKMATYNLPRLTHPCAAPDLMAAPYTKIDLWALSTHLRVNAERFQAAIHLVYHANNGHAAYMISDAGFQAFSEDDLSRYVAPDIARQLIRHLKRSR